jgi:hypothetical protein
MSELRNDNGRAEADGQPQGAGETSTECFLIARRRNLNSIADVLKFENPGIKAVVIPIYTNLGDLNEVLHSITADDPYAAESKVVMSIQKGNLGAFVAIFKGEWNLGDETRVMVAENPSIEDISKLLVNLQLLATQGK